jgi:hypothetical protein
VATFLLVMRPVLCAAQGAPCVPELVTDRPGFGESSAVVARGTVQLEAGLTLGQSERGHRQITAPQVLARVGFMPRVELRVATDGLVAQSVQTNAGSAHAHGRADAELGGKVKLLDSTRARVDLALLPYVSLPTASEGFGTGHYDPGVKVVAGRQLARGFGLSGTFNTVDASGDSGRAWSREVSVSLDHDLGSGVGAYGEMDGAFSGRDCGCSVDGGITVAVGANGQFDVEAGRGVHGAAPDWFLGVGFAVRRLPR